MRRSYTESAEAASNSLRWRLALRASSAADWRRNALIFFVGVALGASWGDLSSIVSSYTTVVWIVLALIVAVLLVRWRLRRSRPS